MSRILWFVGVYPCGRVDAAVEVSGVDEALRLSGRHPHDPSLCGFRWIGEIYEEARERAEWAALRGGYGHGTSDMDGGYASWWVVADDAAAGAEEQAAQLIAGTHPEQADAEHRHALIRCGMAS